MRVVLDSGIYVTSNYVASGATEYLTDRWPANKAIVWHGDTRACLFVNRCGVVI